VVAAVDGKNKTGRHLPSACPPRTPRTSGQHTAVLWINAGGGILWATIVGVGFYYFASVLKALRAPFDIAIGAAAVLALVGGLVVLRRKEKPLGTAAERAYPDRWTDRPLSPGARRAVARGHRRSAQPSAAIGGPRRCLDKLMVSTV
jgi:hypothetical protein